MGAPLCAIADVEAMIGAPVPAERVPGVTRLIELASGVVAGATRPLPTITPDSVTTVTATLVTRQYLNPSMAANESLAGYRVGFSATSGLLLTDADREALGDWAATPAGRGAYSVVTPSPFATGPTGPVDTWPFVIVDEATR
jgi:hypothetical protein